MIRNTGNQRVISELQVALDNFLKDHRSFAESDREWVAERAGWTSEEREEELGCGCENCELAVELLGSI
jgi:hypothetical protein